MDITFIKIVGCPSLGNVLNVQDNQKTQVIVGHVPRYISTLCSLFISRGGTLYATVLGGQQCSSDLVQGGMEVPCRLHFVGNGGELKKVKSFYKAIPSIPGGQPVSTNTIMKTKNFRWKSFTFSK